MNDFSVDFIECSAGWIKFTVSAGNESAHISATYLNDPFPSLLKWLEAIAAGLSPDDFWIDEESEGVTFRYERDCQGSGSFTIINCFGDQRTLIHISILPRALIAEFYTKFRAFATSDIYHKEEWEAESIGECLLQQQPGKTEEDFLQKYLNLPPEAIERKIPPPDFWIIPNFPLGYISWSEERKRQFLLDFLNSPSCGSILRELKSQVIEEWLGKD